MSEAEATPSLPAVPVAAAAVPPETPVQLEGEGGDAGQSSTTPAAGAPESPSPLTATSTAAPTSTKRAKAPPLTPLQKLQKLKPTLASAQAAVNAGITDLSGKTKLTLYPIVLSAVEALRAPEEEVKPAAEGDETPAADAPNGIATVAKELLSGAVKILQLEELFPEDLDVAAVDVTAAQSLTQKVKKIQSELKAQVAPPRAKKKAPLKLKTMSNLEKKIATALKHIIRRCGIEFANGTNKLNEAFDWMKTTLKPVQDQARAAAVTVVADDDAPKEDDDEVKDVTADHTAALDELAALISKQNQRFRTDEDLREDFDEDLLQEIAVAATSTLNTIEGFVSPPPAYNATPQYLELKAKTRAARKEKRESKAKLDANRQELKAQEQAKKQAEREAFAAALLAKKGEKQKEKEEKAKAREEAKKQKLEETAQSKEEKAKERLQARQQAKEDAKKAKEDAKKKAIADAQRHPESKLSNLSVLGYVDYSAHSVDDKFLGEALSCWGLLTSLPKVFECSKMPFSVFLRMMQEDAKEQPMACDVYWGVAKATKKGEKWFGSHTRRWWFSTIRDYVAEMLPLRNEEDWYLKVVSDVESEAETEVESEEEGSSSSDSSSEEESSSSEEEEESDEAPESEEESEEEDADEENIDPRERVARRCKELIHLFSASSAANTLFIKTPPPLRVALLKFLLFMACDSSTCRDAANDGNTVQDVKTMTYIRTMKKIHEQYAKDTRKLRNVKEEEEREKQKKLLEKNFKRDVTKIRSQHYGWADEPGHSYRITPLGYDRYNRIYWRFPFEQTIHVQHEEDMEFPVVPKPIDSDDDDGSSEDEILIGKKTNRRRGLQSLVDDDDEGAGQPSAGKKARTEGDDADDDESSSSSQKNKPKVETLWGQIRIKHLESFIDSLEGRGQDEGRLKDILTDMLPWLQSINGPPDFNSGAGSGMRTRSRGQNYGYQNIFAPRLL